MSLEVIESLSTEVLEGTGIHIGLQEKSVDMESFISRNVQGFNIFDTGKILNRIVVAGRFLASFDPEKILVFGARENHLNGLKLFAEIIGAPYRLQRLAPGSLTNPALATYVDADVLFVSDVQNGKPTKIGAPNRFDARAVLEASTTAIPVVGVGNTNAVNQYIDLIIPANNKGAKSSAAVFYLLSKAVLLNRGRLDKFDYTLEQFETIVKEKPKEEDHEEDL